VDGGHGRLEDEGVEDCAVEVVDCLPVSLASSLAPECTKKLSGQYVQTCLP
jgi:hypothetical protein